MTDDFWWLSSTPDDIKDTPWLHPAAVLYLESLLTPDMTVLEHGCGASTIWFAKRVAHVTAVDSDGDWIVGLASQTQEYDNIRLIPLDGVPDKKMVKPVDLLLIDGTPVDSRIPWIRQAHRLVKPGGIVVLDNAERVPYRLPRQEMQQHTSRPTQVCAWALALPPHGLDKLVWTEFYRMKGGEVHWI